MSSILSRDEIRHRIAPVSADSQKSKPLAAPAEPPWPTMGDDAYYGLAGDVVREIGPYTEADPVAILVQFLTCAGNMFGRSAYHKIEGSHHHANLFSVLVGETSKALVGPRLRDRQDCGRSLVR